MKRGSRRNHRATAGRGVTARCSLFYHPPLPWPLSMRRMGMEPHLHSRGNPPAIHHTGATCGYDIDHDQYLDTDGVTKAQKSPRPSHPSPSERGRGRGHETSRRQASTKANPCIISAQTAEGSREAYPRNPCFRKPSRRRAETCGSQIVIRKSKFVNRKSQCLLHPYPRSNKRYPLLPVSRNKHPLEQRLVQPRRH